MKFDATDLDDLISLHRRLREEIAEAERRKWADTHAATGRRNVAPHFMARFGYTLTPDGWRKEPRND